MQLRNIVIYLCIIKDIDTIYYSSFFSKFKEKSMRFTKNLFFFLLVLSIISSCKDDDESIMATVEIIAKNNSGISGTVTFSETDGMVTMQANITGLSEGLHAIHIHETGDCSADDGTSAGGHWNPTNTTHGEWGGDTFHIGDIGNLDANASGTASISRTTNLWCIGCSDATKNVIGKAIIIHEGPDDFTSQPSGAAGPRIGCGEINM